MCFNNGRSLDKENNKKQTDLKESNVGLGTKVVYFEAIIYFRYS